MTNWRQGKNVLKISWLIISGLITACLAFLSFFYKDDIQNDLSYFTFIVAKNKKEIFYLLIGIGSLFVFSLFKVELKELFIIMLVIILGSGFISCYKGDDVYKFLVQKKRYLLHTMRIEYFNFTLLKALKLESQGRLNEAKKTYDYLYKEFPNYPDIDLVEIIVNKLRNRELLAKEWKRQFLKNQEVSYRNKLAYLIYLQYLSPDSKVSKKLLKEEYEKLNKLVSNFKESLNSIDMCDIIKNDNYSIHPVLFAENSFGSFNFNKYKIRDSIDCKIISKDSFLRKVDYLWYIPQMEKIIRD